MTDRHTRQSFLGPRSEQQLHSARVAVIGLGGGGSHVAQQLAHIGIGHVLLCDPDSVELTNLNRLIGATPEDAKQSELKVRVAERHLRAINPELQLDVMPSKWQLAANALREVDVIFSCMDSYGARQDIEATARRFLIPLIDIGMDVHVVDGKPSITGQIIVSIPEGPCMKCLGFLTDRVLQIEADAYGAAGARPQVIWANGVLASVAVGLLVDLLTDWTETPLRGEYLHYDGNTQQLTRSPRLEYAPPTCPHFPLREIGEPGL